MRVSGKPAILHYFLLELPRRCIKLFSFVGDVVLDPFLGSGTTLLACAETQRQGIGIEIDKVYQRAGRPDRITLIESAQLDKSKLAEWGKLEKGES